MGRAPCRGPSSRPPSNPDHDLRLLRIVIITKSGQSIDMYVGRSAAHVQVHRVWPAPKSQTCATRWQHRRQKLIHRVSPKDEPWAHGRRPARYPARRGIQDAHSASNAVPNEPLSPCPRRPIFHCGASIGWAADCSAFVTLPSCFGSLSLSLTALPTSYQLAVVIGRSQESEVGTEIRHGVPLA